MEFFSQYHYYLSFFCGCAFLFFSLSCFLSWRLKFGKLSYFWVMLFGLFSAVIKFMQMSASGSSLYALGKYPLAVSVIFYISMIFFFMSAQETYLKFKPQKKFVEYTMALCSLACLIIGFCFGLELFNISVFALMWIPSSAIMILSLSHIMRNDKYDKKNITHLFAVFILYCIVFFVAEFAIMLNLGVKFQSVCNAVLSVIVFFIASKVFKYFKVSHEKNVRIYDYMPVYWRHIPIGSILFAVLVGGLFFTMYLENYSRSNIEKNTNAVAAGIAETINSKLNKSDQISGALSKTPFIRESMYSPSGERGYFVNNILDDYCKAFNVSMIFTVNDKGDIVFYSKLAKEADILNVNLKYRPYFVEAMEGLSGRVFAKNIVGQLQSYFSSDPIRNVKNDITGAVVVQENIDDILLKLREYKNIFVIDENGVVFLSDRDDTHFNYLWPLYGKENTAKGTFKNILSAEVSGGETVILNDESYYVAREYIGEKGWSVIYFSPLSAIKQFKILSIASVCGVLLIILLLFWSLNQSNRILALALQHKAILNSAKSILIVATDIRGKITVYGQGTEDILGYTKDDFIKRGMENIIFTKDGGLLTFEEAVAYSSNLSAEVLCRRKDGTFTTLLISVLPQYSIGNKLIGYIFSGTDITVMKETETELAQQIKFLQMLIDSMPIAVFYKDSEKHLIGCNKAFEDIMEQPKDFMIGKQSEHIYFDKEARDESVRTDSIIEADLSSITYEKIVKFRNSPPRDLIYYKSAYKKIDGKFGGIIGVILDATQERKMQEERDALQASMIQHNKLASLGELAGSIAHELNNPLSIIMGFAQVLVKDPALSGDVKKGIDNIYEAAKRSKSIITNMLEFARSDTSKKQMVNINDVIESTMLIIEKDFYKTGIEVHKQLTKNSRPVMANPMQIQQVFLNILLNAKDALPRGGEVVIYTEINYKYFIINISDDGAGIPKDVIPKIFDPFFTTKGVGKGTGLGLSICYGIVTAHKGEISVKSDINKGTTFIIKFPLNPSE